MKYVRKVARLRYWPTVEGRYRSRLDLFFANTSMNCLVVSAVSHMTTSDAGHQISLAFGMLSMPSLAVTMKRHRHSSGFAATPWHQAVRADRRRPVARRQAPGKNGFTNRHGTAGSEQSDPYARKSSGGLHSSNRSTPNATLTDQGQKYFDRMKPLLKAIEATDREVKGSGADMSGSIRIAAPTTFGRLHILPTIPNLLAEYPHLRGGSGFIAASAGHDR